MAATVETNEKPGFFKRYVPIFAWLPEYEKGWLTPDFIAGLSVWALMVPQALGYAAIAGVPVQYGLYAAMAGLILYAIFGTSRQMITGPSSTTAAVVGATVLSVAAAGSDEAIQIAAAVTVVAGIIYFLLGVLRMGWLSNFLAASVLTGFITGLAIDIAVGQLENVFGYETSGDNTWQELWSWLTNLSETSMITLLIGVGAFIIIYALKHFAPKVPGALVALVYGILVVVLFNVDEMGVVIVGTVPTGLPSLTLPSISLDNLSIIMTGAIGVVLVGFSESLAAARLYAGKYHYDIDANQEMVAQGFANMGSGLLQGFAVNGSLSKSAANDSAGAKTEMASLIQGGIVILTLLFLAALFQYVPWAVLGAIIIVAVVGLVEVEELKRLYTLNRNEFWLAVAAALGVLTFGTLQGILLGAGLSLLLLIARASKPPIPLLGRVEDDSLRFHNLAEHPEAKANPGIAIIRFEGPLFFANASALQDRIRGLTIGTEPATTSVIIDMEATTYVDLEGADMLQQINQDLNGQGITLYLARIHTSALNFLAKSGFVDSIGSDHLFDDVSDAVSVASTTNKAPVSEPSN